MIKLSTDIKLCPYHYSKHIMNQVNILVCPYNYIINPDIRKNMGIKIEDAIIVFDEAHNLESVGEDALSL